MDLSNNTKRIQISGIRRFYNKVSKYEDVISLTLGQPDFKVPQKVEEAMIKAIREGKTTYTSNQGLVELRTEISNYLRKMGISYNPDEICITIGGSEAITSTFTSILNSGDKVLLPDIAYPAYEAAVKLFGGEAVHYGLSDSFNIDFKDLYEKIEEKGIKAIVLSFPSNPTGAVLSKEDKNKLIELLSKKDIIIISDEIYGSLFFEETYYSISQEASLKNKIILIGGFSKMFSMTGLRIGYVCAEKLIMDEILKVHQYNVSCAPSISQYGALCGLQNSMDSVSFMRDQFIKRRDYVYGRLLSMGFDVNLPKGAFYIFPSIRRFGLPSEEFCTKLLEEAKVACVPGSAFGSGGEGYMRLSYSYSLEELTKAMDRIEKYMNKAI